MKEDEKKFFRLCWNFIARVTADRGYQNGRYTPRELIIIIDEWLPHRRAWFYLNKWDKFRFYEWGTNIEYGWLLPDKIPQRYRELIEERK